MRIRFGPIVATVTAGVVAAFMYQTLAGTLAGSHPDPGHEAKVVICHVPPGNTGSPKTLSIDVVSIEDHSDRPGDYDGPCRTGTAECGDGVVDESEQCDDGNTVPGDGCDASCNLEYVGQVVEFEGPPPIDAGLVAQLPTSPDNAPVLIEVQGAQILLDATLRDPLTALGRCTAWIATCVSPPERSLDDCARSARHCESSTPWLESEACCPAACFQSYEQLRLAGQDPVTAFTQVYFADATCFPGVSGMNSQEGGE